MKKITIALVLIALVIGGLYGYKYYQNYKKDDEIKVTTYQECVDKNGAISGNFKEKCEKDGKIYPRELTNDEKKIQERYENINLTVSEYSNVQVNEGLVDSIKKTISKYGGEDYEYFITNNREYKNAGIISVSVSFTADELLLLPSDLKSDIVNGVVYNHITTLNLLYSKADSYNYKSYIQNEKGIDEIIDLISSEEMDPRVKLDYSYDLTRSNQNIEKLNISYYKQTLNK